jgi:hypothetical protein
VDTSGSGLCPVVRFGISSVELSGSANRKLVAVMLLSSGAYSLLWVLLSQVS